MPEVIIFDLDERTLDRLASEACRRNLGLGATAGELLRERFGTRDADLPAGSSLESLAGTWTDAEARSFLSAVADFDRVDPDLWK